MNAFGAACKYSNDNITFQLWLKTRLSIRFDVFDLVCLYSEAIHNVTCMSISTVIYSGENRYRCNFQRCTKKEDVIFNQNNNKTV